MKLRNANKAQVAMFIIIGILVVGAILILIFISKYIEASEDSNNFPELNTYINNIHRNALTCTVYMLGKDGKQELGLPTLQQTEEKANLYLPSLINPDWKTFPQYKIKQNTITSKVSLSLNDVSTLITNNFIATKDTIVTEFKDFSAKVPIRYAHIHKIADIQFKDPAINLNELADVDLDKEIKIGNRTTFKFTDKQSKIDNKDYEFFFSK